MNHADSTAPIYAELIREQGDVPGDARRTAEEVLRDLSRVIHMPSAGIAPARGPMQQMQQQMQQGQQMQAPAPGQLQPMQPMHPMQ
ncbi:hypothetical protein ACIGEZ_19005 [Streptomyces sp. NPDC085481]|uniref:hypothetical protein n=1 Tax=Streptomyces sp. NPDC085481 TaxID=3365727 RepID=UPI0037D8509B